jgi:hypothetical protein
LLLVVAETDARVLVRVALVRNAGVAGATDGERWKQRVSVMIGTPDFERMSTDEIANWLLGADDITPWREWAKPSSPSGTFVQIDLVGEPVERVVTMKMPSDMVATLHTAAGRNRAGRSGHHPGRRRGVPGTAPGEAM